MDISKYIKKDIDISKYVKKDGPKPAVAASTAVDVNVSRETPDTIGSSTPSKPITPMTMKQAPVPWTDVIGRGLAGAASHLMTPPSVGGETIQDPPAFWRAYGYGKWHYPKPRKVGGYTSPQSIGRTGIEGINDVMRGQQTEMQNIVADLLEFLPYTGPQGLAVLGKDLAEHPSMPIDMLEQSGQSMENILAGTRTLGPMLELANQFQQAKGQMPTAFSQLPENMQESILESKEIMGAKAIKERPVGEIVSAGMPAAIATGLGVKGAVKAGKAVSKVKSIPKAIDKYVKPDIPPFEKRLAEITEKGEPVGVTYKEKVKVEGHEGTYTVESDVGPALKRVRESKQTAEKFGDKERVKALDKEESNITKVIKEDFDKQPKPAKEKAPKPQKPIREIKEIEPSEARPAIDPYSISLSSKDLKVKEGSVFHGTSPSSMVSILKEGKIKPRISKGDKLGESVVSMTKYEKAGHDFGIFNIELKDRGYKDRPSAVKGDYVKGLEVVGSKDISISDIKKVHVQLGTKETLNWKDYETGRTLNSIIKDLEKKGIEVEVTRIKPKPAKEKAPKPKPASEIELSDAVRKKSKADLAEIDKNIAEHKEKHGGKKLDNFVKTKKGKVSLGKKPTITPTKPKVEKKAIAYNKAQKLEVEVNRIKEEAKLFSRENKEHFKGGQLKKTAPHGIKLEWNRMQREFESANKQYRGAQVDAGEYVPPTPDKMFKLKPVTEGKQPTIDEYAGSFEYMKRVRKQPSYVESEPLQKLHKHPARAKGLQTINDKIATDYLDKLSKAAKGDKTNTELIDKAYDAYQKGNYGEATKLSEKVLSKIHENEMIAQDKVYLSESYKKDYPKPTTPPKVAEKPPKPTVKEKLNTHKEPVKKAREKQATDNIKKTWERLRAGEEVTIGDKAFDELQSRYGKTSEYNNVSSILNPQGVGVLDKYIAKMKPSATERHAGFNPFTYIHKLGQKMWGAKGDPKGRRVVNVLGSPEIVLEGRGIVEHFREAKHKIGKIRPRIGRRLDDIFTEIRGDKQKNTNFFNHLIRGAKLTRNEKRLADLLEWGVNTANKHRIARGQEPIKKLKNYAPQMVKYTLEMEKLYQNLTLPKKVKFPFEKRKGSTKFERDIIKAAEAYFEALLKDIYIGDALAKAIPNIEKLTIGKDKPVVTKKVVGGKEQHFYDVRGATFLTERAYAEAYIRDQLGWPTGTQKAIQAITRLKPKTQTKISQAVTFSFYRSLIGMALDTSVKNLTQGINTLSEFGVAPTLKGYSKLATKKGRAEIKAQNLLEEFEPLLQGGHEPLNVGKFFKKFDDVVLAGPMRFAEFVNRGATFHAALDVFIKKGMPLEKAIFEARASVRKLQFAYGRGEVSPYLRGPLARMGFQFTSFPLKQTELMFRWAREGKAGQAKLFRYLATSGALVLGGKYAGVDVSSIFFDPLRMVDPDSKDGIKLPGSDKKVELSFKKLVSSGFFPQGPAPVFSAPKKIMKGFLSDDEWRRKRAWKDTGRLFVWGGRYGTKVWDVYNEMRGEAPKTYRDRKLREPSKLDAGLKLAGLRSTEREAKYATRDKVAEIEDFYYKTRRKIIDDIVNGKDPVKHWQEIAERAPFLAEYLDNNLSADAVRQEYRKKLMTTEDRFYDKKLRKLILQGLK